MSEASADTAAGVVELRLRTLSQLFNSLDPSPFLERDLDEGAERHIVGWARELPSDRPVRIIVHIPEAESQSLPADWLPQALSNYFAHRAEFQERELRELFRNGRRYLSIGVPILLVCLSLSQVVGRLAWPSPIARVLEESLIIVGWVANWKPIETFLYDWWPLRRHRDLYRRLARASVEVRHR